MQTVYYNRMKLAYIMPLTAVFLISGHQTGTAANSSGQQQPAPKPLTASALDSHDGFTIAADPWLSVERYRPTFPKKTPFGAGVVAIKMTFRNDSDESVRVGLERIRLNLTFDEDSRQDLPPLTSDQLADAVLHPRLKGPAKVRIPIPIPTSPGGRDKNWHEYQKLAEDAGVHAGVVAPHSTIEGLLYFDLQNQFELLQKARLYIPDLVSLERNHALMYFDIDLGRPSAH